MVPRYRPRFSGTGQGPAYQQSARIAGGPSRAGRWLASLCLLALAVFACSPAPGRNLGELVVRDSTYLDPATMLPYSGPVFQNLPGDEERVLMQATLRDGTWEGELTVYHETGRIRYQGEMAGGAQCGGWIQNEAPEGPESVYEAIKEDLESLVIYPECPGG